MKTLADFKRDIKVGDSILCVEIIEHDYNTKVLKKIIIPEKLSKTRLVTYKDTTGFYLKGINDTTRKGSFCNYPKAPELLYDGDTFKITEKDDKGEVWQVRLYQIIK